MKKLNYFLEKWELSPALALSLRMTVSGYEASRLPTQINGQAVPVNRLSLQSEADMPDEAFLLDGKLSFRRIQEESSRMMRRAEASVALCEMPRAEQKKGGAHPQNLKQLSRIRDFLASSTYEENRLQIKSEARIQEPIVILMNNSLKGIHRLDIDLLRASSATLVLVSQLDLPSLQCIKLRLAAHARLELIWLTPENAPDSLLNLYAELDEGSELRLFQPMLGGDARIQNQIFLNGRRSRTLTYAPAFAAGAQKQKIETNILHRADGSYSRIRQKGVLLDRAQAALFGRQIIEKETRDTDCYQESRFLVSSDKVRAHSHPVLVIDDNEVQAGHAASVGRMDPGQRYYLMSRGLNEAEAERLITVAFLRSLIEEISVPALRDDLVRQVLNLVEI